MAQNLTLSLPLQLSRNFFFRSTVLLDGVAVWWAELTRDTHIAGSMVAILTWFSVQEGDAASAHGLASEPLQADIDVIT